MRKYLIIAAILGALSVVIGAFGAHALKPLLSVYQMEIFHTGVLYQFIHAIVLLQIAFKLLSNPNQHLKIAFYAFVFGIIFFSFSLYILACIDILQLNNYKKIIGPLTPIGGVFFIAGWIYLIFYGIHYKKSN